MEILRGEYSKSISNNIGTNSPANKRTKRCFENQLHFNDEHLSENCERLEKQSDSSRHSAFEQASIVDDTKCGGECQACDGERIGTDVNTVDFYSLNKIHSFTCIRNNQVPNFTVNNFVEQKKSSTNSTMQPHNSYRNYNLPHCQFQSQNPTSISKIVQNGQNGSNNKDLYAQYRKNTQNMDITAKRQRRKRNNFICHSIAKKNTILLAKKCSYKPKAVFDQKNASDNFYSALFTTIFCCFPFGLASLIISCKVRAYRADGDFERAQQSSLLGRKLSNTGIMLGMCGFACALFYFLININIPYVSVEYSYYLPEYNN